MSQKIQWCYHTISICPGIQGRGVCSSLEQRPKVPKSKNQGLWSGEEGIYLGFLRPRVSFLRNTRRSIYGYTPTNYRDRDRIHVEFLSPGYNSIRSLWLMFSWRGRYSPDMDGGLNHQMLRLFMPVGVGGSWTDEQFLLPCCPRNLQLCRLVQEQEVAASYS